MLFLRSNPLKREYDLKFEKGGRGQSFFFPEIFQKK